MQSLKHIPKKPIQPAHIKELSLSLIMSRCSSRNCSNYPEQNRPLCHVTASDCGMCPTFWVNYEAQFEFKQEIKQMEFSHNTIYISIKIRK